MPLGTQKYFDRFISRIARVHATKAENDLKCNLYISTTIPQLTSSTQEMNEDELTTTWRKTDIKMKYI